MIFKFPLSVPFYAFFMAGPCDFAINVAINTLIPWWVFGEAERTPLYGPHSLFYVMLAITFFCATLTTVSGYFNCVRERKAGRVVPPVDATLPWGKAAWSTGLKRGVVALAIGIALAMALYPSLKDATVPTTIAIWTAGLYAGTLGYWLHAWAIITAGSLNRPALATT